MSDVLTKSDLYTSAIQELSAFPVLAARVNSGDVLITQQIAAIAQMLSMVSWQIGMAEVEPWTKARDSMVLADAMAKGVLPYAKPPRWKINVKNNSAASISISAGRRLLDNKSRIWVVEDGATVTAGALGSVVAVQEESKIISHTVSTVENFYKMQVPELDVDQYLTDIGLIRTRDSVRFYHAERYNNVNPLDKVYHITSDESLRIWIEFGVENVAGYVPTIGEEWSIVQSYTYGKAAIENATPFGFEYSFSSDTDKLVELYADSMVDSGAMPLSIPEMREITSFPSTYDVNAVYLAEFQFLLMREFSPFVFLSVWNEQLEEAVRGANVSNINVLFISFLKDGADAATMKADIVRKIQYSDDSYDVKFVPVVEKTIPVTVSLRLSPIHDADSVKIKVREVLLAEFGRTSIWSRRGRNRINWQAAVSLLRSKIIELQDNISDVSIAVTEDDGAVKPEEFRYVAEASLTINNSPLVLF